MEADNILYIHTRPSGGAGESLRQLVKSRIGQGKSIVVFADSGFLREEFENLGLNPPPIYLHLRDWIHYKPTSYSPFRLLRYCAGVGVHLISILRLMVLVKKHKIQIIHTNAISLIEGAILSKIFKIPHVWQIRELIDLDYYLPKVNKRRLVRILEKYSDVILCNSYRTKESVLHFGARDESLHVIHNMVNPVENPEDIRELITVPENTLLVGILGWITPNKKVEDFIEVASRFYDDPLDIKFVIIGGWGWSESYNQKIKEQMEKSPNHKNIILTGIVPDAPRYLGSLDILLNPCFTESFGRTTAEALIAGTPAISIRGTATQEIIDHGETGFLVEDGDIDSMVKFTRLLLDDEAKRITFGKLGQQRCIERFSDKKLLAEFHDLYRKLIESSTAHR
ncbi:glycosyltransferase family 4 protein [bacterium]|nr:glycosyltransferase family 4 protein [bacterium]